MNDSDNIIHQQQSASKLAHTKLGAAIEILDNGKYPVSQLESVAEIVKELNFQLVVLEIDLGVET